MSDGTAACTLCSSLIHQVSEGKSSTQPFISGCNALKVGKIHHDLEYAGVGVVKWGGGSALFIIFFSLVSFFLWLDPSQLPDYEAYENIYYYSLLGGDWEIFFVSVNVFFRSFGFSYPDFRGVVLIFLSCMLWLVLLRLRPSKLTGPVSSRMLSFFLMFFVLAVFLFEYAVIRIRAGFAMTLVFCAIFFLLSPRVLLGRALAVVFLALAFFTHGFTALILLLFLGMPFLVTIWKRPVRGLKFLFSLVSTAAVAYLLYAIDSSFELRGEHLASPLNPVRFVMLSIMPLMLLFFMRNESRVAASGCGLMVFPAYFVRFYAILAIGLALMFFAGRTGDSGEALVRLYTLSSIPALLSLGISGSAVKVPISSYILVVNALFFLVTVLSPS